MQRKVKIGKVKYLNCLPLFCRLGKEMPEADVIAGTPAYLNRLFLQKHLFLNSISSIEYARSFSDLVILPGLSIASTGPVGSILLFSKVPLSQLGEHEVAVTTSSATSSLLLQIILHYYLKIKVTIVPQAPNLTKMLARHSAALLIGDDALKAATASSAGHVYDLGELWTYFTTRPMVYALFCVHKKDVLASPVMVQKLHKALLSGKLFAAANMPVIARKGAWKTGLPYREVLNYLCGLSYDLTPAHIAGYRHFIRLAAEIGAAPAGMTVNLLQMGEGGEYHAWESSR